MDLTALTSLIERSPSFSPVLGVEPGNALTIGVSDAAKAVTSAALGRASRTPVIVITARPSRAETLAEELPAWLGDAIPVLLFPERDPLPYERIAPDLDAVRSRLAVLSRLATGDLP